MILIDSRRIIPVNKLRPFNPSIILNYWIKLTTHKRVKIKDIYFKSNERFIRIIPVFVMHRSKINNSSIPLNNDPNNLSQGLITCVISSHNPKTKIGVEISKINKIKSFSWIADR